MKEMIDHEGMPKFPTSFVRDISHQAVTTENGNHNPIESYKHESLSIGT
jgi:hypothetical protein